MRSHVPKSKPKESHLQQWHFLQCIHLKPCTGCEQQVSEGEMQARRNIFFSACMLGTVLFNSTLKDQNDDFLFFPHVSKPGICVWAKNGFDPLICVACPPPRQPRRLTRVSSPTGGWTGRPILGKAVIFFCCCKTPPGRVRIKWERLKIKYGIVLNWSDIKPQDVKGLKSD